ncbi:MAG: DedA family protein [Acidobacteria bacterium]|nr:DedA family protein [Acidobacteriota bacterium]
MLRGMVGLAIYYGYLAIFLGTMVEGETFILLGGFLAHRGYLGLVPVVVVATLGAYAGDLVYFSLGRTYGRRLWEKSRRAARLIPWLESFMHRYHVLWVFSVRYLWGMRWLAAMLAGSSKLRFSRYAVVDLAACLLWAGVIGLLGYGTGEALERLLGDVTRYEGLLVLLLALASFVYALIAYGEERRLARRGDWAQPPGRPGEHSGRR